MMEDIVLLETKHTKRDCEVFRLQFAIGGFSMVIFDLEESSCEIYEIKHSMKIAPEQCRHLLDEQKCRDVEFKYGAITGKYVIYKGENAELKDMADDAAENVIYLNVEEYLKKL